MTCSGNGSNGRARLSAESAVSGVARSPGFKSSIWTTLSGAFYWMESEVFGGHRQQWAGIGLAVTGAFLLVNVILGKMLSRNPTALRNTRIVLLIGFVVATWLIIRQALEFKPT
ncbi:MAG: hypothetical protein JO307_27500 [Bryobacterales bacterium]|nr:hypothetical protein [Bryobacterales bacterium]